MLGDEVEVSVERGFSRDDAVVVAVLLGVFALLILVITLTSTALTLAEQQTDQATLAALGRHARHPPADGAAAAFLLAAVGCVLGVAVGLVPGIAIARPLTSTRLDFGDGVPAGGDHPRHPVAVAAGRGRARPPGGGRDRVGRHPQGPAGHPPHHLTPD